MSLQLQLLLPWQSDWSLCLAEGVLQDLLALMLLTASQEQALQVVLRLDLLPLWLAPLVLTLLVDDCCAENGWLHPEGPLQQKS
jgi:hypothetical protein